MYLAGVRPNPSSDDLIEVIPEVANLSSSGLTALRNNSQVVDYATLSLTLRGVIAGGDEKMLIIRNNNSIVTVKLTSSTDIVEPPREVGGDLTNLNREDLILDDAVTVSAELQGDDIVAKTVIRDIPPPFPATQ